MFRSFHFRFAAGIKENVRSLKDVFPRGWIQKGKWIAVLQGGLHWNEFVPIEIAID